MELSLKQPNFWEAFNLVFQKDWVWVSPTDTIFGIAACLNNKKGAARIRDLKNKPNAQLLILVANFEQADALAELSTEQSAILKKYWPGSITFVLHSKRGQTIALRNPSDPFLIQLMEHTGPIFNTSCNLTGSPPVANATEARALFGNKVDLYIDGPSSSSGASTLVDLTQSPPKVLRRGTVHFDLGPTTRSTDAKN